MRFQPIENYGVIGNMKSIALVGMNGSIDFLCYPNFDSPTVFASLLDEKRGGRFQIEPQLTDARVRQLYLPDTNILITRFLAEEGVAELTDFMPIESEGEQPNEIVRMVTVIRGTVLFHNALPATIQICDVCAPNRTWRALRDVLSGGRCVPTYELVFHSRSEATTQDVLLALQPASR